MLQGVADALRREVEHQQPGLAGQLARQACGEGALPEPEQRQGRGLSFRPGAQQGGAAFLRDVLLRGRPASGACPLLCLKRQ